VETLPSDQEVLTQLQSLSQQGDSAPSTNFVGKAIVENTLNSFSSTQSHRIDRSHGVDLKALTGDAGEQKAQKTSSARPTFLPGDNGGLVIEGEGNSVVTPSAEGPRTAFDGVSMGVIGCAFVESFAVAGACAVMLSLLFNLCLGRY